MKLGILVPTNNPPEYESCLGPSINTLVPLLKHAEVSFLFNFQPPWSRAGIIHTLRQIQDLGFGARHIFTDQKPYSAYVLRQQAAILWREADLYMICDDNLIFKPTGTPCYPGGSATRYAQLINYFETYPNCGMVMCDGSLGGSQQRLKIGPTTSGLMATARGLFFRNLHHGQIHTTQELTLQCGLAEPVLAYTRMEQGYFLAKQFNNPTQHKHLTLCKQQDGSITNDATLHAAALAYIRARWNDPTWTHSSGKMPIGARQTYLQSHADHRALHPKFGGMKSLLYWKDYA